MRRREYGYPTMESLARVPSALGCDLTFLATPHRCCRACFKTQKSCFRLKAAGKTGKRPIAADNTMARNHNR